MNLNKFFSELKRRNVYKVALTYAIVAWLLAQMADSAADSFNAPEWVIKMIIVVLFPGFPIALILAWAFEMSPQGMIRTTSEAAKENTFNWMQKFEKDDGWLRYPGLNVFVRFDLQFDNIRNEQQFKDWVRGDEVQLEKVRK